MNVIVTWMYSSPKGEDILHNQVGRHSSSAEYQNYYWRCVFLLFESSARLNRDTRHLLFVNKRPPAEIDGIDTAVLLRQYRIEVVEFGRMTLSPKDYHGAWNTQFLVLDVLDWLAAHTTPDDAVFVLDSDIVFVKPIDAALQARLRERRALLYTLDLPEDYVNNGLTPAQLLAIARELAPDFPAQRFAYSGGEIICLQGSELARVAALAREAYEACLARHARGQPKFNEEAHLLSYVYQRLGYADHSANDLIKRIWTDRSTFCNVDGSEAGLVMWHLPAEKKSGYVKRFRSLRRSTEGYVLPPADLARLFRLEEGRRDRARRLLFWTPARRLAAWLRGARPA